MYWTVKIGTHKNDNYSQEDGVRSATAHEALKIVAPNFKWATGIRVYSEPSFTIVYSGPEGWAKVSERN